MIFLSLHHKAENAAGGEVQHQHEEIFLPLGVDEDGNVEGLLIDDLEAEKGALVIEEIVDESGTITDIIIERASDLSIDNLPQRQGMNRKFGSSGPKQTADQGENQTEAPEVTSTKSSSTSTSKKRNLLPLIILLVTVAFSLGFVLSVRPVMMLRI